MLLVKAAVLGSPVAHSLSPILHNSAYRALGLDHVYSAIEVSENDFPTFISNLDDQWLGVSLTMPLKEVAFQVATETDLIADQTGAINTLIFSDGITGYNTDVAGIVDALVEKDYRSIMTATIFGSGATARSALVALHKLGVTQVECIARNSTDIARMLDLGAELGISVTQVTVTQSRWLASEVVVNTTPVGVLDHIAKDITAPRGVLLDVVYNPWPTQLAASWSANGGAILSGLSMLLHQGAHQVSLMTKQHPPLAEMRTALNLELLARGLKSI